MEEIEVSRRDFFRHDVEISEVGSRLDWKFSTKKKNIGFGLFYKPDPKIQLKVLPDQFEAVFQSLGSTELKITPPAKNSLKSRKFAGDKSNSSLNYSTSTKHRPSNSVYQYSIPHHAEDAAALSLESLTLGRGFTSKNVTFSPSHSPSRSMGPSLGSDADPVRARKVSAGKLPKKPTKSVTLGRTKSSRKAVSISSNATSDRRTSLSDMELFDATDVEISVEILPIQKYNSYKYEVSGFIVIPLPGTYTLFFDNTFSVHTSKHLYYQSQVKSAEKCFETKDFSAAFMSQKGFAGWILKRRRSKMKGYSKKWAVIGDGKLTYYDRPDGDVAGIIDICTTSISKIPSSRKIIFDSGRNIYQFRALTYEDYLKWVDSVVAYKRLSEPKPEHSMDVSQKASELLSYLEVSKLNLNECLLLLQKAGESGSFSAGDTVIFSRLLDKVCENILFVKKEGVVLLGPSRRASVEQDRSRELSSDDDDDEYYDANDVMVLDEYSSDESLEFVTVEETGILSDEEEDPGEEDEEDYSLLVSSHLPLPLSHGSIAAGLPGGGYFGEIEDVIVPISMDALSFLASCEKISWPYRKALPHGMCPITVSIASLFRKSIGKDSSSLSMPICLNEPVNLLQRMCQEFEYAELLNIACYLDDPLHRLIFISAFACSSYSYTLYRAERKPFNPLLGETFEYVCPTKAFRFVGEKVCHNPPTMACHVQGCLLDDGSFKYEFSQDFRVKSKFWGKSIEFTPYGTCRLYLHSTGEVFTWKKVTSSIHNVIGGTPWAEHYGEMKIINRTTGDFCRLDFKKERGIFSQSSDNEVVGGIYDADGIECYTIKGCWNERLFVSPSTSSISKKEFSTSLSSMPSLDNKGAYTAPGPSLGKVSNQLIWQRKAMPEGWKECYGFNEYTMSLNELLPEMELLLPPTDTRFRPDQRLYEQGNVALAEPEKGRLEEIQRERRKHHDTEMNPWKPLWFRKEVDDVTKEEWWTFEPSYWTCKKDEIRRGITPPLW